MSYLDRLLEETFVSGHPAEYLDRSDLQAFADCPHQGQLRKKHAEEIQETYQPLPEASKIMHAAAEVAIKSCNMDLQEAADYIAQELPKTRPDLQPDVLRAGWGLARRLRYCRATQVLLCEEQISRQLFPETTGRGEFIVTTRPDLVLATNKPDTIAVRDYKGGWKKRTNQEARDDFQTCTICWGLKAKYPTIQYIDFAYWETRTFTVAHAYIDLEQVVGGTKEQPLTQEMAFEARIVEAARLRIEGCDEAWPLETKCAWCPVIKWCKFATPICTELDGDPEKFGKNYVVLKEAASRMEKAIAEWDKIGRTVYIPGGVINGDPKKRSPRRISVKKLKEGKTGNED